MRELFERVTFSDRHHWKVNSSVRFVKNECVNQCTSYLRERESTSLAAHPSIGLKLNHKTKFIGAFTISNIYFKCQAYMTLWRKGN